jgi:Zn-dependent peptidase ImmA (M78 family)
MSLPLFKEFYIEQTSRNAIINNFVGFVIDSIGISKPHPKIILNNDKDFGAKNKSFGHFNVGNNEIVVAIANRNLADALRTLAHELVHYKQKQAGKLELNNADKSGADGSDIENEANAIAGVILRKYGKLNPAIYQ